MLYLQGNTVALYSRNVYHAPTVSMYIHRLVEVYRHMKKESVLQPRKSIEISLVLLGLSS